MSDIKTNQQDAASRAAEEVCGPAPTRNYVNDETGDLFIAHKNAWLKDVEQVASIIRRHMTPPVAPEDSEIDTLKADNAKLREALGYTRSSICHWLKDGDDADGQYLRDLESDLIAAEAQALAALAGK